MRYWRLRVTNLTRVASRMRYRRNRMLEYKLLLRTGFQQYRELIEALNPARQFRSMHEVDGYSTTLTPCGVQKRILNILGCRLRVHDLLRSNQPWGGLEIHTRLYYVIMKGKDFVRT